METYNINTLVIEELGTSKYHAPLNSALGLSPLTDIIKKSTAIQI